MESPSPLKLTYLRTKSSSSSSEHSSNHDEFSSNSYAYNHEPVETPTPPKLMYPRTKSSSSSEQGSSNHDESSLNSSIPTEIELWTKEELLFYGLSWVGYDRAKQQKVNLVRNLTRWREHYGPPPATYAPVVNDVCGENGSLNVKKFMMAVNWAKCRNRRSEMNARWQCCEENVIPTVFKHLEMIQRMKSIKIRFEFYNDKMIKASLDCVHFTVNEFRDEPSAAHYDHKSASCGVVSDVVC